MLFFCHVSFFVQCQRVTWHTDWNRVQIVSLALSNVKNPIHQHLHSSLVHILFLVCFICAKTGSVWVFIGLKNIIKFHRLAVNTDQMLSLNSLQESQ